MMPLPTLMLVALSVICWTSFAMAIMWHFVRPAEASWLMRSVASLGTLFGLLQVAAIIGTPAISVTFWIVAVLLYGSALSLFWWTLVTTHGHGFFLAFSPFPPTILLAEGPYRWVRHPFYTSYVLYWMAGVSATASWWISFSVLVMGALYWRAAVQEETEFLQGNQSKAYRKYMVSVGRFFPTLRRSQEVVTGHQNEIEPV